jgi:uncharacterized protein (DUF1697 family)
VTTYIGLLRAVNLGSHNKIAMPALREIVEGTGATNVRTYIQSGNVVFDSTDRSARRVEATLEAALAERGLTTPVMVRSASALDRIIEANPFPDARGGALLVVFLKTKPKVDGPLDTTTYGSERATVRGTELYVHYPDGVGRSKLTGATLDRLVGTPGTGRNWNTVNKLAEMAGDRGLTM